MVYVNHVEKSHSDSVVSLRKLQKKSGINEEPSICLKKCDFGECLAQYTKYTCIYLNFKRLSGVDPKPPEINSYSTSISRHTWSVFMSARMWSGTIHLIPAQCFQW